MSLFQGEGISKGYASNRPYFHPKVIEHLRLRLNITKAYRNALDVGCGAGLSSLALKSVAKNIYALDSSMAMIESAINDKQIEYFNYSAEEFSFDKLFELITLSGSINWINRELFFINAKIHLAPNGYMVIYDNNILGEMIGNSWFKNWYIGKYLEKFPKPPREESSLDPEMLKTIGLSLSGEENYTNIISYDLSSFISYLFTQTNVNSVIEYNSDQFDQIYAWLRKSLEPFFKNETKDLLFGGYIWYVENQAYNQCFQLTAGSAVRL